MDLSKLSGDDLYGYLGVPVKLELSVKDGPICGNVYTIDPETNSVVLMQFETNNSTSPSKLTLVPGSSIKFMYELGDDELMPGCVACSSQPIELMENRIQKTIKPQIVEEDESVVEERFNRLTEFLASKNVPFTKDNQVVRIGPVRIERPYRVQNIQSENLVALQRTQKMLSSVLL